MENTNFPAGRGSKVFVHFSKNVERVFGDSTPKTGRMWPRDRHQRVPRAFLPPGTSGEPGGPQIGRDRPCGPRAPFARLRHPIECSHDYSQRSCLRLFCVFGRARPPRPTFFSFSLFFLRKSNDFRNAAGRLGGVGGGGSGIGVRMRGGKQAQKSEKPEKRQR